MTKMNSILEDKTAEIIESTAKTGINVAKTMALAGADEHVTHGLIENVGTFDVVGRVDPDELTCGVKKEIFQDLLGRAQELAHASLIKDELRDKVGAKDTILVVNQIWINYDPKENKKNSSNEIRANVAKSNFITGVTRAITLENFGKNYVNGIVTRIPAFAEVTISATPQIRNGEELPVNLKDFVKARIDVIKNDVPKEEVSIANANTNLTVDKQTCQTQKVQVEAAHKLQIAKNKNDKEHCRKLEASYKVKMDNFKKREDNFEKRATAIVQQAQSVQLAKAEQGILEKGKDEMTEENTVIYKALVPISQLGRIGVIPVHSNTFVKQTKNVDINVDTGRVASYDFEASSSGEKAALMLEHISESVVKDVPEIIKGLSAGKSTK
ncbi:MAG: hypothetical protein KIT34_15565 [Cyanobacteria bacterium TGS_CYA1]|nr:hypothetical protein [Cyanobacteria bacterium TGS_CYA1]